MEGMNPPESWFRCACIPFLLMLFGILLSALPPISFRARCARAFFADTYSYVAACFETTHARSWRLKTWEKSRLNIWKQFPHKPLTRIDALKSKECFLKAAATHGALSTRANAIWNAHRRALASMHGKPSSAVPMMVFAQEAEYYKSLVGVGEMPVWIAMPFDIFLNQSAQRALEINCGVAAAAAEEAQQLVGQG